MAVQKGDRVRDRITGLTGIVWGITSYLHGCNRIHVQPDKLKEDGSMHEAFAFDEPQVEVLDAGYYFKANPESKEKKKKPPGGPAYLSAAKHSSPGK